MADYGFKVSPPGVDVLTANDEDLAFTSKTFGLKVALTGTIDVTITSGASLFDVFSADVTHSLGYVPAWYAFIENEAEDAFIGLNVPSLDEMDDHFAHGWSDGTKLRLNLECGNTASLPYTRTFRYYIFAEDQNI